MVIKPVYFGTVTDALKVVYKARAAELTTVVAADRNDTDDDFIADFAMAIQADYIKFGAPSQGERVEKYNRLLKIEQLARMQGQTPKTAQSVNPTQTPSPASAQAASPAPAAPPTKQ